MGFLIVFEIKYIMFI